MAGLTAQPLGQPGQFNWVFLVELLVCGILGLFFLFYFNRLFATVVSYAIRAYTWHKFRAYIDISALQISLLGGRLFFKSIRYHAHNETILVRDGHVTWRYWLRAVQEAEFFEDEDVSRKRKERSSSVSETEKDSESGKRGKQRPRSTSAGKAEKGGKQKKELPCRISVKVTGVEAFIYNRSPVYDGIVEATRQKAERPPSSSGSDEKTKQEPSSPSTNASNGKPMDKTSTRSTRLSSIVQSVSREEHKQADAPAWLRMLPIKVECKRAAAVLGNEHTPSVITAKLENANGTIDAGQAGPLDQFKLLFNFDFKKVNVAMKPNRDFKQLQLDAAQRILREKLENPETPKRSINPFRGVATAVYRLKKAFTWSQHRGGSIRTASIKSDTKRSATPLHDQIPGQAQWHGLTRYLDDNDLNEHDEWANVEYAKSSTLVDCEQIGMRFYFDQPGTVPENVTDHDVLLDSMYEDDANGSRPPDYGLDLFVHGGVVVYGPWADRQRIHLQHIFVPMTYVHATPLEALKPGETRVWTMFKIKVIVEQDVVLRIPMRESSKDSKWQGRSDTGKPEDTDGKGDSKAHGKHRRRQRHGRRRKGKQGISTADARPYAWLDITVKADSVVNYNMDMFARRKGYHNTLDLDVKGIEMESSVNHALLWRSGKLTLDADLSNPCEWNTRRKWPFNIVCDDLELFILRDHMFQIIDLVNDWSSGPPPEFYTFVPYRYILDLTFRNFVLYLNTNDANIINEPADFDSNDFLTIEGRNLHAELQIPLEKYRPKMNGITFDVLSTDMAMRILNPSRSTLKTLLQEKKVAELPKLTLKGSYTGNSETAPGLTDILRMDLVGTGLSLKAFGFVVRHFINVKENYFGDYVHFKTLEEFQGAGDDMQQANTETASLPKPQDGNELDVILCIVAEQATVMLPTNLYSMNDFVRADLPLANIDLRITSYYFDMAINFSPISILSGSSAPSEGSPVDLATSTQLFLSHVDLTGHRLFGLKPNEPSYTEEWGVDVGSITGECSSSFMHGLALAAKAFVFAFQDGENALPIDSPAVIFNATFLQLQTDVVRVWLHAGKDALLFSAQPVTVGLSDWAGELFSQRVSVLLPSLTVAVVDARSASRHRVRESRKRPVRTYALLQTGATLNVVSRKMHFEEERMKQQAHIRRHDQRTHRTPFLIHKLDHMPAQGGTIGMLPGDSMTDDEPPAMPFPGLPFPLDKSGRRTRRPSSVKSVHSYISGKSIRSKSSSSSLAASVRGHSLAVPAWKSRAGGLGIDTPSQSSSRSMRSNSPASSNYRSTRHNQVLPDDQERARFGLPPSTMAFSSSFSEPYFPLDVIEPDESNVPQLLAQDAQDVASDASDALSVTDTIEDADSSRESAQTTIFVKLDPGIRGYVEPRVVVTAAKLLKIVQPTTPEDVMDDFQQGVMNTIGSLQQERRGEPNVLEVRANLPSAQFRVAVPGEHEAIPDTLDLSLKSLDLMMRMKNAAATDAHDMLAMHVTLESLDVSLQEGVEPSPSTQALRLTIDDALIWMTLAQSKAFHVSARDTAVLARSGQALYITNLVLRLLPMVQELESKFSRPFDAQRKRLHMLVYELTQQGEHIGDPTYMTRMTYILRAFPDHYRNQESWKVLARFRHMLQYLPHEVSTKLSAQFKSDGLTTSESADAKVLETWAQWRNWDVPNVNQTLAFRMLFTDEAAKSFRASDSAPTTMTFKSEVIKVSIDDGANASGITIEDTSLGLDITPPTMPTGLMLVEENKRTKTLLQLHTASIGFLFDWTLCALVEDLLPRIQSAATSSSKQAPQEPRSASQALEEGLDRYDFHVVFSTDSGSVSLQSINLRHRSQADNLKMSLIGTTQADEQWGQCASALINADVAVTELHGQSRCIWQTLLTSPSIYIDHLQPAKGVSGPPTITFATAYRELQIDIQEQVPGILHVIDSVIQDEVTRVLRMVDLAQQAPSMTREPSLSSGENKLDPKIHVALLAGQLSLEVCLLQALNYRLEGSAASLRVAPSLSQIKTFGIDFDLGRQNHSFVNRSGDESHQQGLLDVPPINGHIGLQLEQNKTDVSLAVTIERVEIDASAVQSLIAIVNRPEVQQVITEIEDGVQEIKHHVDKLQPLNPSPQSAPEPPKSELIVFDARTALLGIRVACSTPQVAGFSTAEVEVGFGAFHATASNRAVVQAGGNSLIPEVRAQMQDIGASLSIHEQEKQHPCGNVKLGVKMHLTANKGRENTVVRQLTVRSPKLEINAYPETAATIVDVINHLEDRIKDLDLSKEVEYIRRIRESRRHTVVPKVRKVSISSEIDKDGSFSAADILAVRTTVELDSLQATWQVNRKFLAHPRHRLEDPVLSLAKIQFTTRGGNEARLTIQDLQLQLVPKNADKIKRTLNSALLPEMGFSVIYWSHGKDKSFAFKATGKPLDLRLESRFMVPANAVKKSIEFAIEKFKLGTATWQSTPTRSGAPRQKLFASSRLKAVLVEADFAGAQVYIQGSGPPNRSLASAAAISQEHGAQHGRYGQFATEGNVMHTTLKAPGFALKVEYDDAYDQQPIVNGELRVDASSNNLLPNVVPLILEIAQGVKQVMQSQEGKKAPKEEEKQENKPQQRFYEDESIVTADPSAFFGKTKVNLGLRICRQEFGLTCQPIAKVDAKAELDDFYITMNTIDSEEHGHFFAISAVLSRLNARVKHVYSRDPTFSYEMESIVLSLMNSKHFSGVSGVSAILKINPTKLIINGKQLQDLLLFREIWLPPEIRANSQSSTPPPQANQPDEYLVQRYHTVAAAAAFPWNATVAIAELAVDLDLGQSIGKSSFTMTELWASSSKSSNWEQNLCIGLREVAVNSSGRMSGFIRLAGLGVRTSIKWPEREQNVRKTPLIQASVGFSRLRAKAAFDYQAFAFGDIEGFDFLMYNVRETHGKDRLVAVLDCEKAYVFCTSTSPAQALGLFQAFDRLIQEKQTAYKQSLTDIEKHLRRESTIVPTRFGPKVPDSPIKLRSERNAPISLHTDVVVTLGTISVGAFPSTFFDSQILKLEANNIQARFAVGMEKGKVHSGLGMTLGQLQVALASVKRVSVPKTLGDISVDEVISSAVNSRGGTILRVPKVSASMQTWQAPEENNVDYVFRSLFEGKIEVGWNLSRINFIKGMWITQSRSLASRLGKQLPESAVKITAGPHDQPSASAKDSERAKITAEVNLPQSKYEYRALEPPVIETPQLRDMGEATPPLEWVGLHRDRLPNVTHQIIIVSLLEVAKEVEDAYERILGSS